MNSNSDSKPDIPDLATLRDIHGTLFDQQPEFGNRYVLRPSPLRLRKQLTPIRNAEEMARRIDKRPLLELKSQIDEIVGQVVVRAAAGDDNAIHNLVSMARGIATALETIQRAQPKKVQAVAEESVNWPVLLSPIKQDIDHARRQIEVLQVGRKAPSPRRPGQKIDPRGFWTRLAEAGFKVCQDNRILVPVFQAHCEGTTPMRNSHKSWGITAEASYYYVTPTDVIIIADWETTCINLSLPVTRDNIKDWWHAIKHYTLEYWTGFPDEYDEALRQIGHEDDEEWQRRGCAVDRVEQAFRDSVGLR
jgi:hypothetical protein